ncbi:MAG: hemerythrin domain-containing protein, partial [Bacillota bacterium]|nr:hemerythrin domain-containing protein [Bacillota bacterium]
MSPSSQFQLERIAMLDAFLTTLFDIPETDRSAYARKHFALIDEVTPFDVLGLNRFKQADAAGVEAIRKQAGKLVHILRRGLLRYSWNREIHPALIAFRKENGDVTAAVLALAPLFAKLHDPHTRTLLAARIRAFSTLERKFRKAELLLHPAIDAHLPSPIPLKVLWALHDDIRAVVRELPEALEAEPVDAERLAELVGRFHYDVTGLVEKEELILYPAAAELLSAAEWDAIGREAPGFGYAFGADP